MKLFDSKLKFIIEELGHEVQVSFLHSNAHFLLGVSGACEKALAEIESGIEQPLH